MSTIAQSARAGRAGPRTRVRRRPFALGGGVVWIVLFAALLAGVVAVNVAVLRADVSRLRSELSVASATSRIDRLAVKELGLVKAEYDDLIFVRLNR